VFGNSKYLRRREGDDKTVPFLMLIEYNRVRAVLGLKGEQPGDGREELASHIDQIVKR
jgi:hypothetical protein